MTTQAQTQTTEKPKTDAALAKINPTAGERFTNMVVREFAGTAGEISLTSFQKRLVQNYFIHTDIALRMAEEKRMKKAEQYRDPIAITWENVNMPSLALRVVACARIGFDPALPNHINMVPYKNNTTNKYDITFIEGYRGKELKAMKYGFEIPTDVIVKLVYSAEKFIPVYKDKDNKVESYIHHPAEDPFNRGDVVGGYYYHVYSDRPEKNKLVYFNKAAIEKRKPEYASAEFWGGEKTKWKTVNGKNVKDGTEKVEGWYDEMAWKTIYRAAYSDITIDSQKIDDDYIRLTENEREFNEKKEHDEDIKGARDESVREKGAKKTMDIQDTSFEDITDPGQKPTDAEDYEAGEKDGHLKIDQLDKPIPDGPGY